MEKQIRMLTETDYTEIDNRKANKIDMPTKLSQLQDNMGYGVDIKQLHEIKADKTELPKTMNDLIVSHDYPEPGGYLLMEMENEIGKFQEELDTVKQSGVESNKILVDALNSKGVSASTDDSVMQNISKVNDISNNNFKEIDEIPTYIPTNSLVVHNGRYMYITQPEKVHEIFLTPTHENGIISDHKVFKIAPMVESIMSYKVGKYIVVLGNHRDSMAYTYYNTETNGAGSIRLVSNISRMKWGAVNTKKKEVFIVDGDNNLHKLKHDSDSIISYVKLIRNKITLNHSKAVVDTAGLICSNVHPDAEMAVGVYNIAFDSKTEDFHNVSYPPGVTYPYILKPLEISMLDTSDPDFYGRMVITRLPAYKPNVALDYDTISTPISDRNYSTDIGRFNYGVTNPDFSILYGKNGLNKNMLQHKTNKREFLVPTVNKRYVATYTKLVVPEFEDGKTVVVALGDEVGGILYSDGATTKILAPVNN